MSNAIKVAAKLGALPKSIEIHGRRWFQRSYGNTYHSVRVFADNKLIGIEPFSYGYGSQYVQTAKDILVKNGIIPKIPQKSLWSYCNENNIELTYNTDDVKRKKDLVPSYWWKEQ